MNHTKLELGKIRFCLTGGIDVDYLNYPMRDTLYTPSIFHTLFSSPLDSVESTKVRDYISGMYQVSEYVHNKTQELRAQKPT